MLPIARPKPGETEEDLLRQQEEFLKSKSKPAAQLIRKPDKRPASSDNGGGRAADGRNTAAVAAEMEKDIVEFGGGLPSQFPHTTTAPPVKKSKFREKRDAKKEHHAGIDVEEQLEKGDTHITKVLTEIVERDIQNIPVYYPEAPTIHGFPTAPHRGGTEASESGNKKMSIFAQQFASGNAGDFGLKNKPAPRHESMFRQEQRHLTKKLGGAPAGSAVISGKGLNPDQSKQEATKIHEENVARMASMSEADILAERQKLMEGLDPSVLAFFKSKKKPQQNIQDSMDVDQDKDKYTATNKKTKVSFSNVDEQMDTKDAETKEKAQTDVELPIKPSKKWANMNTVEAEKLEWTKDLPPPPKADSTATGQAARFDFNGNPVAVDADVPTQMGLHHHGSEPERAGYTLEELFQLSRSANMQQRVVALNTIARILEKANTGALNEFVQSAIIPALLDGGLVHILRWALDDSTDNTMAAAVQGHHALLVSTHDEEGLDKSFSWHHGLHTASLQPPPTPPPSADDGQQEETDAQVLKEDVIKGLLRMQILQRLRYLLEVWRPPAPVVIHILQILTRIARHSAQSAYEIAQCPRLLDTIFKEFLPTTWSSVEDEGAMSVVHGYPVPDALKLIRVICAAGNNMAASIISKYWLMTCISRYIVEEPSHLQLPLAVASHLQVESLRNWRVLTTYGLASQSFSELYPVVTRGLQYLPTLYHVSNPALLQWGEAMLGLLESHVALAATSHKLALQQNATMTMDTGDNTSLAVPDINWSHVTGLFQPVELCLQNAVKQFIDEYPTKKHDLTFASCCMNFVATYLEKMDNQPGYNAVEWLDHLERLTSSCLLPCVTSVAFQRTLNSAREHSVLLRSEKISRREMPASLPEHGALVSDDGETCPLLKDSSTVHFVLALVRLLAAVGRIHKDVADKLYPHVLKADDLVLYVRKSCQVKHTPNANNAYARYENLLHYYLLRMARIKPNLCDSQLLHQLSLFMLPRIQQGDEHLAHDLLSTIIFNSDFFGDLVNAEVSALSEMELLQLSDQQSTTISSATQQVTATSREQLAANISQHLASMRGSYLASSAALVGNLQRSRGRLLMIPQQTEQLMLGPVEQLVAPIDWPFLPLVELYNDTTQGGTVEEKCLSPQLLTLVTDSLRFIYALERWRPGVLDPIKFVTKLSRLMCTFLAGSDLFLDAGVHTFLEAIIKLYCRPVYLERMDFTKRVPGLMSFYDFYVQFLMQYEAVSFGDSLFGSYLLLPMQQRHNSELRRALWMEHDSILRVMSIPLSEVPIPIENFLHPDETDVELIRLYYQALYSGTLRSRWSPLLYLIAVHHLNRFVYMQEQAHDKLRISMIKQLPKCKHEGVQKDILHYKKSTSSGMEYYDDLPPNRQARLQEALGS